MPKTTKASARPPKARTSGQTAGAEESVHGETEKTADLRRDTIEAVMTGNQGVKISDDQNSLKAGGRGRTLMEGFHLREKIIHSITSGGDRRFR
jgi:catalase